MTLALAVDDDAVLDQILARHRWRYGVAWKSLLAWTIGGVFLLGYGIGRGAVNGHMARGAIFGVVAVVAMITVSAFGRPGVRVTAERQPELYALVQDVALRIGFRPPDRIWLTHTAKIEAQVRPMRRELLVGRAVVPCLPEPELRALIAHELAILQFRRAWLVTRLARRWWAAATIAAVDPSPAEGAVRTAAHLRPIAEAVHVVADAAAIGAAGHRRVVARAFVLSVFAGGAYRDLAAATAAPPRRWWQNYQVIEDLDDAWQRFIAHESAISFSGPDASDLLDLATDIQHPALTSAGRGLLGHSISLTPTTRSVRIHPLTRRQQRRLARRLRKLAINDWVHWYTCETAPAAWWSDRAKSEADDIRRDVAAVLGRAPVDDFETVEVLITRNAEILAVLDSPADAAPEPAAADSPTPDPSEYAPPLILCGLVEDALLHRGWRIEHPAIRGVLIGPRGERIDAARSVTLTETGFDLERLRTVLRPRPFAGVPNVPRSRL